MWRESRGKSKFKRMREKKAQKIRTRIIQKGNVIVVMIILLLRTREKKGKNGEKKKERGRKKEKRK